MKKITSKKQLQEEKERLRQKQLDLENKIRLNWSELKYTLRPSSLASEAFDKIMTNKAEQAEKDGGILKSTFTYGFAMLAKKLVEKATARFGHSEEPK